MYGGKDAPCDFTLAPLTSASSISHLLGFKNTNDLQKKVAEFFAAASTHDEFRNHGVSRVP
jgi:hypothetical protein